jgi:hypothetical protein
MSYQEKKTIASKTSTFVVMAAYCIYVITRWQAGAIAPDDLRFWAGTILIFLLGLIVLAIITQIAFHVLLSIAIAVRERERDQQKIEQTIQASMVEDEMDQIIELKSVRIGFASVAVGFVAGLVSLVLGGSAAAMLNILFLSFGLGSLAEGIVSLRYYRKGV